MFGSIRFHAVGIAGGPPTFDKLTGGTKRCRFSLAINEPKKVGDKWEEETTWITCALFGRDAERESLNHIRKGEPVYVEGRVASYPVEFALEEGVKVFTQYTFRPEIVRPMGSRPQETRQQQPAEPAPPGPSAPRTTLVRATCRVCGSKTPDPLGNHWAALDLCGACNLQSKPEPAKGTASGLVPAAQAPAEGGAGKPPESEPAKGPVDPPGDTANTAPAVAPDDSEPPFLPGDDLPDAFS